MYKYIIGYRWFSEVQAVNKIVTQERQVTIFLYIPNSHLIIHILHLAFEDGPDRGFRNVGKPQYNAGEIPKRTYTV
jgi:hypothetical protein